MSRTIKEKRVLLAILVVFSIVVSIVFYIKNDRDNRIESYLQSKDKTIKVQYNTIYKNYKIACNNVYMSLLNNKDLVSLFKKAKDSNTKQQAIIREKMHTLLKERYERIKLFGVWQLHFHLPNNDSFLRMHKPNKFGDNLSKDRYSVAYVNKHKKSIEGFEVGKIIHGFRFVYPMFDERKKHIGSVEISMSSEIFKETIEGSYDSYVEFILSKETIQEKLFRDEISNYYEESIFNSQYLKRKDDHKTDIIFNSKDKKEIEEKLKSNKVFSISLKDSKKKNTVVTFLPIKNIKENKKVAYFIAIEEDSIIKRLYMDFYIIIIVVAIIGVMLVIFYIKDETYKEILEEKIDKKTNSLKKQKEYIQRKYDEQTHILNTLTEAVLIYENDICTKVNKVAVNMLSIDETKLVEVDIFSVIDESLKDSITENETLTIETLISKNKAESFPALLNYHSYKSGKKKIQILSLVDLTELKNKEKHLLQQSKLAQMGEMISMIAHQWRQPLAAISSTTNGLLLKSAMGKYEKEFFNERLSNISEYSQHLSSTIDDFRNFFKSHKEKREIKIETVVEDSLRIIKNSVENKNIKVIKEYNECDDIFTYPNELRQVVLNLLKNAEDALLEKEIEDKYIKVKVYKDSKTNKHTLEVSDNAGGIDNNIIDKIFEPYFSTKTNKNGTGLGLYMSKTIIEDHCSGKLEVFNDDKGAVFKVSL